MEIARYTSVMQADWDAFVDASRQGIFLFKRGYMDYHSDRFDDFSLVATERDKIVAVLPANRVGKELHSHQGLTFGGWLTDHHIDTNAMMSLWARMSEFLKSEGIGILHYKPIPYIYADGPAQEDRYALFRAGAIPETCLVSSVIDYSHPITFNQNMRRNSAKARKAGICVGESLDYDTYWALLCEVLAKHHNATPVHSIDEIKLLSRRFDNIRLYTAHTPDGGRMVAGVIVYASENVARAQYIATNDEGRNSGALAYLFELLIKEYSGFSYFDFGTSNENGGLYLNEGLIRQKTSMGGRAVTFDSFRVDL